MSKKLNLGEFMDQLSKGLQARAEAFSAKCDELAAQENLTKSEASAGAEKKKPKGNEAFTMAWQKYKKDKQGVKKDDGMDDMAMGEKPMEKKDELSAATKEKHPSIAESYEETPTPHPSAKPNDKTKMGKKKEMMRKFEEKMSKAEDGTPALSLFVKGAAKRSHAKNPGVFDASKHEGLAAESLNAAHGKVWGKKPSPEYHSKAAAKHEAAAGKSSSGETKIAHQAMAHAHKTLANSELGKAEMCAKCGKKPCICLKKDQDLIDTAKSNIPDKQLKRFGGEKTVIPSDKAPNKIAAPGSGGEPEPLKQADKLEKADLKPGHSFSLSPVTEKHPTPAKHEAVGEGKAGGDLKPGHEMSLSPVSHLKAPPAEKRVGMVQRIHQAAKAKMGMGKSEPSMKKDQAPGTMPKLSPVTPLPPEPDAGQVKSPVLKSEEESKSLEKGAFDKLKNKLSHEKGVTDPAGLAAKIGMEKESKKTFEAKAKAGKNKAKK